MKVSIKQISEITGFSPATISNALNRKKGVNQHTAAIIYQAAKSLGYINEDSITKFKLVIYKKNGMIIDDTPFFSLIIDGFENECRTCGYEMAICYVDQRSTEFEREIKALVNDSTSAITLLGTELESKDFDLFKGARCPVLTLDYWNSDMSFNGVFINNRDSAKLAVDYLVERGHTKIGYLRGNFRIKAFRSRANGFKSALIGSGIAVNPDYVVSLSTKMDEAYKDMLDYLHNNLNIPTAYFADNDMIALGAMKALQECGYRIPDDISIIGFDDIPYSEIASPRLTSLRVPKKEMGQIAVRRMIDMMKHNNDVILKTQVCTSFIERDSVRDLREK